MGYDKPMTKVKCKQCGKEIDKKKAICVDNRKYVCSEACQIEYQKAKEEKEKPREKSDREKLLDYLNIVLPQPVNWILVTAQIKAMMKTYSAMTYGGMLYTFWYVREVKNKDVTNVSICPYYYEEARAYYRSLQIIKRQIEEYEHDSGEQTIERTNVRNDEIIFE